MDALRADDGQPPLNRLLGLLSDSDLALLRPHLTGIDLELREPLETPNRPIEHVFFFETGLASIVATGPHGRRIEVGIIGREGMTGLPIVYGDDRSPNDTFVQSAGRANKIGVSEFREALAASSSLARHCMRFAQAFNIQTAQTALANGRANVDERLARWLLMAHDRADGNVLTFTHEFLALMLGVRRAGVTMALQALEGEGLIRAVRGRITIRDRPGLEELADGYYGVPESELDRLFASGAAG